MFKDLPKEIKLVKILPFIFRLRFWLQAIAFTLPWNNVLSSAAGLIFSVSFVRKHRLNCLDTPLNRGWLIFSAWLIFTTCTAYDFSLAWTGLLNFLPFILFSAIARFLLNFPQKIQIAWLTTLSSLSVGILGILQVSINRPDWQFPRLFSSYILNLGMSSDRRVTSWFGHFNELAIYLLLVFPLAVFFIKYGNRHQKIIAAIALSMDSICLYFSGSRNAWILATVAVMVIALYYRYWRSLLVLILAGLATAWAVFGEALGIGGEWLQLLFPSSFVLRLQSAFDPNLSDFASTGDRLNAWKFALNLISQRPILGWGLRSFPKIAADFSYDLRGLPHEHNFYLLLAVGAGIPAVIGFCSLMVATAWQNLTSLGRDRPNAEKDFRFLTWLAIAMFFLFSLVDVPMYEPRVNLLVWLLVGL
jgi:O-antigen ligase